MTIGRELLAEERRSYFEGDHEGPVDEALDSDDAGDEVSDPDDGYFDPIADDEPQEG